MVLSLLDHPLFSLGTTDSEKYDINLRSPYPITLKEALCGCKLSVPTINTQHVDVVIDDVIHPGFCKRLVGHGLRIKDTADCGDLCVSFNIIFPEKLSKGDRSKLMGILPDLPTT